VHRTPGLALLVAALGWLAAAGCSTPGPLHLYSTASGASDVHDVALNGADVAREVPSYLEAGDELTGFAYDPFTDHFFLRLAPGNHIRVVDRPARKIKREFNIDGLPPSTSGDMAVCPRDGHLFLVDPTGPTVFEASRLGKLLRRIDLTGRTMPATAIAYDAGRDQLIVLSADGRTIERFDRAGARAASTVLARPIAASIAYDADHQELYAPLRDAPAMVGVFDAEGRCGRTVAIAPGDTLIDVGPHSFLRVF
jgi:hypothetical protein